MHLHKVSSMDQEMTSIEFNLIIFNFSELINCGRYNPNSTIEANDYEICRSMTQAAIRSIEARMTWTMIASILSAFLICFIGKIYSIQFIQTDLIKKFFLF